jgi:hypothetical protein
MAKSIKGKRSGFGLQMRTFTGKSGRTYIVFKLPSGAFHAFLETEAKEAAKDCGALVEGNPNTRLYWANLWNKPLEE